MPRALIDTSILVAAACRNDPNHQIGLKFVKAVDDGSIPDAVILDQVLAETLDILTNAVGHEAAVDFLDRIESNARFHVVSLTTDAFATAKSYFRNNSQFSFVDACVVAYMENEGLGYLYTLDDTFEALDEVRSIQTPTDPVIPNNNFSD